MAEARIDIRADLSDVTQKFTELRGQMDQLAGKAADASTKLAEATKPLSERLTALASGATAIVSGAAAASGALVTVLTKNAGQYAEQVTQISQQTGLTTNTVQVLGVALNRAGLGLGDLLPAFRKLSNEIENLNAGKAQAIEVFDAIGVSADDLKGKSPDQVFRLVAEKLASLDDGFTKTNASAQLFGRSGLKFIPVLGDASGGFEQLSQDAHNMGAVLDQMRLTQLAAMDDKFDDLRKTVSALGNSFGANFAQPMGRALDFVTGVLTRVTAAVSALPQPLVTAFGVLAVGGAAVAPALLGLAALVKAFETLTPLVTGLYALILAHPFVAVGMAVVLLASVIIANWDAIKTATTNVWNGITSLLTGVWEELKGTAIVQWTELKVFVTQTLAGMVADIGNWLGPHLKAAMDVALAPIQSTYQAFAWLRDKVTGHSEIPDMVQEIGDHMQLLDARMGSPARIATTNTLRTFRDFRFSAEKVLGELASVSVSVWGNVTNQISGALAKSVIDTNNWAKTLKSIEETVLTGFINLGIQMASQWAISSAKRLLTATTTDAAIAASNAATDATIVASNTAAATASTAIWSGAASAILGFFGTITGGFTALAAGLVTAVTAVGEFIMGVLSAIAKALADTIFGIPVAVAILAGVVAIGAALAATDNLPKFGDGGMVFGPTLALVGEKGPEIIAPLDKVGGLGGSQTIVVKLDSGEILRATMPAMKRYLELRGVRA